jgi:hypothetical protein
MTQTRGRAGRLEVFLAYAAFGILVHERWLSEHTPQVRRKPLCAERCSGGTLKTHRQPLYGANTIEYLHCMVSGTAGGICIDHCTCTGSPR